MELLPVNQYPSVKMLVTIEIISKKLEAEYFLNAKKKLKFNHLDHSIISILRKICSDISNKKVYFQTVYFKIIYRGIKRISTLNRLFFLPALRSIIFARRDRFTGGCGLSVVQLGTVNVCKWNSRIE